MKQTNDKLQRTKALALVLSTLGLMLALSQSAWAGGKKTHFTTTLVTLAGPPSGTVFADDENLYIMGSESAMTEAASDPRVTGSAVITVDAVFDLQALTGPMWGKSHRPHANGAWDGYWTGTRTAFEDPPDTWHVRSTIVSLAVGSGAFAGLVARWDLTGVDVDLGNPLTGSGYIIEAKGGPVDLTLHWVGGTGRFGAAVGEINGMLMLDPREGTPLMDLSLNAQGTIRY